METKQIRANYKWWLVSAKRMVGVWKENGWCTEKSRNHRNKQVCWMFLRHTLLISCIISIQRWSHKPDLYSNNFIYNDATRFDDHLYFLPDYVSIISWVIKIFYVLCKYFSSSALELATAIEKSRNCMNKQNPGSFNVYETYLTDIIYNKHKGGHINLTFIQNAFIYNDATLFVDLL